MRFFSIIIPTFNSAKTLERAVESVETQTFSDYELIIVDDVSTDNTPEVARKLQKKYDNITFILSTEKLYNGGARNLGISRANCEYLLFLDSDDELADERLFQDIHNLIIRNDRPDMVRLPYDRFYDDEPGKKLPPRLLVGEEKDVPSVACSKRVACWTKAVKKELFVPFPENTLFEDVVQHLAQCDVINTIAWLSRPFVIWHIHSDSTSHNNSPKWQSSAWRHVANLMDLELKHDYCIKRRDEKLRGTIRGIQNGLSIQ